MLYLGDLVPLILHLFPESCQSAEYLVVFSLFLLKHDLSVNLRKFYAERIATTFGGHLPFTDIF